MTHAKLPRYFYYSVNGTIYKSPYENNAPNLEKREVVNMQPATLNKILRTQRRKALIR